ncbi:hypothetical protein O181_014023 [Austropuccinia psidii MF-1]|uniref:Secreted protein n=1 Tax=Austropuccinia psidii MF-1 TaxID=1389203 RepID=A0A9Q3GNN4_9BASI|nr:hypothetical protein [Austropuccinia psidii MF-1]
MKPFHHIIALAFLASFAQAGIKEARYAIKDEIQPFHPKIAASVTNNLKKLETNKSKEKTLFDELREKPESEIQRKLSSRQDIIDKLSKSYTSLKSSMKLLQENELLRIDYSSFTQAIHTPHPEGSYLQHISQNKAVVRESYARKSESRETALNIFEDLKDVYEKITILVANRLISLAGLHSQLAVITKTSKSNMPAWISVFFKSFAFLGLNDKELDLTSNLLSQEVALPKYFITMINQQAPEQLMKQIDAILHNLNFFTKDDKASAYETAQRLETQVLFETCAFQALDFLYENKLCDEAILKKFILTGTTLEKLHEHLKNIYRNPASHLTLIPEFSFLLNEWNTAHLHNLLAGFHEPERARLVEVMLIGAIQEYRTGAIMSSESPQMKPILNAVTEEDILKYWWSNDELSSLQQEKVKNWFLQLIEFFGQAGNSDRKVEYMISYYLLDFAESYQTAHFTNLLLTDPKRTSTFYSKLELFHAGVKLHENVNRLFECHYLLGHSIPKRIRIRIDINEAYREALRSRALQSRDIYTILLKGARDNKDVCKWINENSILNYHTLLPQHNQFFASMWFDKAILLDKIEDEDPFLRSYDYRSDNTERITRLAHEYSALRRSLEIFGRNDFLKVDDYLWTQPRVNREAERRYNVDFYSVGFRLLHPTHWADLPNRYLRDLEDLTRQMKEQAAQKTVREMWGKLKEICKEVTILGQHRLLQLKGVSSPSMAIKDSGKSPTDWLASFFARFAYLDQNELYSLNDVLLHEVTLPYDSLYREDEEKTTRLAIKLNSLLHEINTVLLSDELQQNTKVKRKETKILFEICIFQALDFMYSNQVCDEKVLKTFFSPKNTLERTYEHLRDLFTRRSSEGIYSYFALMPELSFLMNDWRTAHLHNVLAGEIIVMCLESSKQAYIVNLMMIKAMKKYRKIRSFDRSPEMMGIVDAITNDDELKRWWLPEASDSGLSQEEHVNTWIRQLVLFFGQAENSDKKYQYLLSYYLLNFIKTYHHNHFAALPFEDLGEEAVFNSKYELFEAGVRLHQTANRLLDYQFLPNLESHQKEFLTGPEITWDSENRLGEKVVRRAKYYNSIRNKFMSQKNTKICSWIKTNSIIHHFDSMAATPKDLFLKKENLWHLTTIDPGRISAKLYEVRKDI